MMRSEERQAVIEQLAASEAQLLALVDGLSPAQWKFQEAPERWSIAGNVEHLTVFEGFIRGTIAELTEGTPEPEKMALAAEKKSLVLGVWDSRGGKLQSREPLRPAGRWADEEELVAEFRKARALTVKFAAETDCDLRGHFFPHIAFGDLDCYQWLEVVAQHTLRHCVQIEEVLRDVRFPAE
jgi:DinB superfamily